MKLGIMQPYFLPYLGYWQLINAVDIYVLYDDVNYINRGWINRNRILINKQPHYFNILLKNKTQNKLICEIDLDRSLDWRRKLLKTFEMAYHTAPYFSAAYPIIEKIISYEELGLSCFLEHSIRSICDYIGIKTNIIVASKLTYDRNLKGEARILNICDAFKADEYYNAIGGKPLYHRNIFLERGIQLRFLKMDEIVYHQFEDDFIGGLSIADVLMFNSKNEVHDMLLKYQLES